MTPCRASTMASNFRSCPTLRDALVFEQRLEDRERRLAIEARPVGVAIGRAEQAAVAAARAASGT